MSARAPSARLGGTLRFERTRLRSKSNLAACLVAALLPGIAACSGNAASDITDPLDADGSDPGAVDGGPLHAIDTGLGGHDGGGVAEGGAADAAPSDMCQETPPPGPPRTLPSMHDPRSAKVIYDEFFGQYLPTYAQFGWVDAPWLTAQWVEALHFPTPPAGLGNELLHNLFDFNPYNFQRPGMAGLAQSDDDAQLFASTSDPLQRLRRYDPTEWMPAVASTYSRTATTDVMATQFWARASSAAMRPALERALELCPDCDDVFTPLSHNDVNKIIEVRFVRVVGAQAQTSRIFKLIGVDASGSISAHTQNDTWSDFGTLGGVHATAKWRMELSGLLAQRYWQSDVAYVHLMPVLVRASRTAALFQYYDGRFDRAAGAPGDPFQRAYNPAADGQCVRDCHAELCQAGRSAKGYYYVQRSDCSCSLSATPIAQPLTSSYYATGACEDWPKGAWSTSPSSGACSPP